MIVVVTGSTGLVGSGVGMSLLAAGHEVVALARPRGECTADQRVRRILTAHPERGRRFGLSGLHVLDADILRDACGLAPSACDTLRGHVDALVHCAADVAFQPGGGPDLPRSNVEGVTHVTELAARLGCPRLVHVGTAYIAPGARSETFRTAYEESKFAGEQRAREGAARHGLDLRIVRPSIVTGDRVHGFTPTYHGIYPFLRYAADHAGDLRSMSRAERLPFGLLPHGRINLVPVDVVAAVIREVACRPCLAAREFNVVNPRPWRAAELLDILDERLGLAAAPSARASAAAAQAAARMLQETYASYMDVAVDVDTTAADGLMQAAGIGAVENTRDWMIALLTWGMQHDWKALA